MKHATSILLSLFGLAVAAPAQVRLEGILGRHVQVGVQVGSDRNHREPVRVVLTGSHGGEHGRGRDDRHDGDDHGWSRGRGDRGRHGSWQTISEEVRVPGYWREECVPAQYGWVRDHCGRMLWTIVVPACHRNIWVPPHCETRSRQVWVPC